MGFDKIATVHQFRLSKDGGSIEVVVRDPKDLDNLRRIRQHLDLIARDFAEGIFDKPFATHLETPPGVEIMKSLKDSIQYTFRPSEKGWIVQIKTKERRALSAVHDFLRYQIREHATGDSTRVQHE
jgi:hypothetical protein